MIANLYNCDNLTFMADKPDDYYELCICDPPYGIGCDGKGMSNRASNSPKFRGYKGREFKGGEWDKNPSTKEYFIELKRVSKNYIIWGANHFIENISNANSPSWVVWHKNMQNPNATNADCELALTSFKTSVKYFRYDWSGFGAVNSGEKKTHPTQKPVKLYEWLLKNYASKGDKIFDSHGGSMSSVIASINMEYSIDCCELDADYFRDATKRVQQHASQLDLFREQPTINIHGGYHA